MFALPASYLGQWAKVAEVSSSPLFTCAISSAKNKINMAEARSAVAEPRVYDFKEGKNAFKDLALAWRHSVVRSFYRTRYFRSADDPV